jgi:hypothetical protein
MHCREHEPKTFIESRLARCPPKPWEQISLFVAKPLITFKVIQYDGQGSANEQTEYIRLVQVKQPPPVSISEWHNSPAACANETVAIAHFRLQ